MNAMIFTLPGALQSSRALRLAPVLAALFYPFLLRAFHAAVSWKSPPWGNIVAGCLLLIALSVPILGILTAIRLSNTPVLTVSHMRGRQAAFLSVCAPPLFVLAGVGLGLLKAPISDTAAWIVLWTAVAAYVWPEKPEVVAARNTTITGVRVAHGISALLILLFALFHLSNHLLGWLGPETHRTVMELGRRVYRSDLGEPILLSMLLFQIVTGGWLVYWWSTRAIDAHRVFQVASGDYLAIFILTHLNSALVSARIVRGVETDWAWASGAPDGLLLDPWNIRLLPHYAFAVFFVLAHVSSGLRIVLLAHGTGSRTVRGIWASGFAVSALTALLIVAALCGARMELS